MDAERIVIWEKKEAGKSLIIQDYGDTEKHRIMGFSMPCQEDVQIDELDQKSSHVQYLAEPVSEEVLSTE